MLSDDVELQVKLMQSAKEIRYPELDAVRGFAALSVLAFHYCLMWKPPEYFERGWGSLLYPFIAGHEAVLLFFLLSGLALAKMLSGSLQSYPRYALRRVLRIYGPYLAALIVSIGGAALWHSATGFGRWSGKTWSHPVSFWLVLQHVLLLGNYHSGEYNVAFWSLVHEMRISFLFPFLYAAIKRIKPSIVLPAAVLSSLLAEAMGREQLNMENLWTTASYIGMFACGVLIEEHYESICRWFRSLNRFNHLLFALVSVSLYSEGHRFRSVPFLWRFEEWSVAAGATGLIILAMSSAKTKRFLQMPLPQFLGRISYSLYLMHGTVLFALTATVFGKMPQACFFGLFVCSVLVLSTLFNRFVEQPFIRLSRTVTAKQVVEEEIAV
jgi:peptidoglycan/LPS O-acetylase OafA/YrhL